MWLLHIKLGGKITTGFGICIFRDATFQEISWNQEISDRKERIKLSLDENNWSKSGEKVVKKGRCIKIHLLKTNMAMYSIL